MIQRISFGDSWWRFSTAFFRSLFQVLGFDHISVTNYKLKYIVNNNEVSYFTIIGTKDPQTKSECMETQLQQANIKLQEYKTQLDHKELQLQQIKSGKSFRVGRFITWLPRKMRDGFRTNPSKC